MNQLNTLLLESNHRHFDSLSSNQGEGDQEIKNEQLQNYTDLVKYARNDFFGYLKDKSVEARKLKVLNIYKYYYRFTQEKIRTYVDHPLLMLFTLQYLKDTKMKRIHTRDTLAKNCDAYYRSIENMINLSINHPISHHLMPLVFEEQLYKIEECKPDNLLCLKRLQTMNSSSEAPRKKDQN